MANQSTEGFFSPLLQQKRIAAALPHISGSVLDFGCGNGMLARFIATNRYCGHDRSTESLAHARAQFPGHVFDATIPVGRKFDTIVALAVIEHLSDPPAALRSWGCLLNDGGAIVLTTPHKRFVWTHNLGAMVGLFSREAADEHDTLFDRTLLERVFAEAGFTLHLYQRFLYGLNQLCVAKRCSRP